MGCARPTVCVITPSYQQGRFIRETIESVLSQDGLVDDYFVVDGGSTDETVSILREYTGRLRWVSERDEGQSHAINKGILGTTGEVIGWLNSDDVYAPGAVAAVLQAFSDNPRAEVVYGDYEVVDAQSILRARVRAAPFSRWGLLSHATFVPQPTAFFRRSLLARIGIMDTSFQHAMDVDFFMRAAKEGFFVQLPRVLARHRICEGTKTTELATPIRRECLRAARKNGGVRAYVVLFGRYGARAARAAGSSAKRRLVSIGSWG